jgi:hypothetical protein
MGGGGGLCEGQTNGQCMRKGGVPSVPLNCSQSVSNSLTLFLTCVMCYTLKMEAKRSSETSVCDKPTWLHIPEDGILQSPHENLNSYILTYCCHAQPL